MVDNGAIQTHAKIVLDKWKQDYEDLYNKHDVANEFVMMDFIETVCYRRKLLNQGPEGITTKL